MRVLKKELWPGCVSISSDEISEIEEWLGKNMGPLKNRWNVVYNYGTTNLDYYFRNDRDAVWFALKWA